MTTQEDPRRHYARALTWVHSLIAGVRPEQLTSPTPCSEYDVRALLGHLVTTVERPRVVGEGGDAFSVPVITTGIAHDGWAAAYGAAVEKLWTIWDDDALLDVPRTVPWGTFPGRVLLWGYINETLVHGWDLAVATGQHAEADPQLAGAVLAAADRIIPAEPRGGHVPFAPPVPPAADAGPTERLANWSGHARPA